MYSTWHDVGGIGEGIDKFGPKNRYKVGFGDTTKAQRAALFEQINIAVHRSGDLVIVFSIGPENVFNQLHIWVFPKENEWFFYYQDSLMSTLMLAPTLFGWIASALVVLAAIFWTGIVIGLVRIEKRIKR